MVFDILGALERKIERAVGRGDPEPRYDVFYIKDKNLLAGSAKRRKISAPNKTMLTLGRNFYGLLRLRLAHEEIKFPFAAAVFPGNNPLKNVLRHARKRNRYFYLLDIKDFYPNTNVEQVVRILREVVPSFAEENKLREFLLKYCFYSEDGSLRIGGAASPDLANLVLVRLVDEEMGKLCLKYGMTYSRYLDDLIFSSKRRLGKQKREAIRRVIEKSGFKINHRKIVIADTKKTPITITGIGIAEGGRLFVRRGFLKRINGLIHLIEKGGCLQIQLCFRFVPKKHREPDPVILVKGLMSAFWSTIPVNGRWLNQLEIKTIENFLVFSSKYRGRKKGITKVEKSMKKLLNEIVFIRQGLEATGQGTAS
ncbi:MAG: reverse transcriptase domain-containing protein [Candidatus Pacebacteria bacterium]|nr:reverse transcriptase domain-containing protein [Candidatus Paceibacterota bacterium]